ncbi:MAG: hypothetical protein ABI193_16435, partial [Minicystis sp.]
EHGMTEADCRRVLHEELFPQIPFEQLAVLIGHDLDGLEIRVIAEQQGIPLSTAYDRYQRGRAALERAFLRWEKQQRGRGLLLIPFGLEQLLEADRTIPELPSEVVDAAWRRFRRALCRQSVLALLGRLPVKPALTHLLAAATGAALLWALMRAPAAPPVPVTSAAPLPIIAPEQAPTSAAVMASAIPTVAATATVTPSATVTASTSVHASLSPSARSVAVEAPDPRAEQRLFETALHAFEHGDGSATLAALQEHERSYPHGNFATEREILWVKTLAQAGRVAEARRRLDGFRGTAQGRALAAQLEAVLPDAAPGP